MKSILDSSFRYTPSAKTDVRKTFARIRRMQKEQELGQGEAQQQDINPGLTIEQVRLRAITRATATAAIADKNPQNQF